MRFHLNENTLCVSFCFKQVSNELLIKNSVKNIVFLINLNKINAKTNYKREANN